MSFAFPERGVPMARPDAARLSRRSCLRWAAASLVAAASPALLRAACPCDMEQLAEAHGAAAPPPATRPAGLLHVCADPDNLPFSNQRREGFEDKIADLLARELGLTLAYQWLPQRMGFFRAAFKEGDNDLVMAATAGFERALTTVPYYRSTYVFVYRKDKGPKVRSFDDPALKRARIGVQLMGDGGTPPARALAARKLVDNLVGFAIASGDAHATPTAKMITALAEGKIDVAVAWGPPAGYWAQKQSLAMEVVPVGTPGPVDEPGMAFAFDICMAVRRPEKPLRDQINGLITRQRKAIDAILDTYGVPRVPMSSAAHGPKASE